jgi:hypothetical protein
MTDKIIVPVWLRRLTMGAAGLLILALTAGAGLAVDLIVDTSLGNTPFPVPPDITPGTYPKFTTPASFSKHMFIDAIFTNVLD